MSIRVLLADDHSLFRQGLRKLLELEDGIFIVGEASDGREVVELAQELQPDVILMDIKMPFTDGATAAETILKDRPQTGIITLTMYDDDGHLQAALQAGVRGYLLKTTDSREVAAAIRAVAQGASLIDPVMTTKMLSQYRRLSQGGPREGGPWLTEKENAVLRLLGGGYSNKEIARELSYSESTVKNRLSVIFEKIGVQDRTQAAIYALTQGLLQSDEEPAARTR